MTNVELQLISNLTRAVQLVVRYLVWRHSRQASSANISTQVSKEQLAMLASASKKLKANEVLFREDREE